MKENCPLMNSYYFQVTHLFPSNSDVTWQLFRIPGNSDILYRSFRNPNIAQKLTYPPEKGKTQTYGRIYHSMENVYNSNPNIVQLRLLAYVMYFFYIITLEKFLIYSRMHGRKDVNI
ncbi:Protein crossbronx [Dirofilaria immitis]